MKGDKYTLVKEQQHRWVLKQVCEHKEPNLEAMLKESGDKSSVLEAYATLMRVHETYKRGLLEYVVSPELHEFLIHDTDPSQTYIEGLHFEPSLHCEYHGIPDHGICDHHEMAYPIRH